MEGEKETPAKKPVWRSVAWVVLAPWRLVVSWHGLFFIAKENPFTRASLEEQTVALNELKPEQLEKIEAVFTERLKDRTESEKIAAQSTNHTLTIEVGVLGFVGAAMFGTKSVMPFLPPLLLTIAAIGCIAWGGMYDRRGGRPSRTGDEILDALEIAKQDQIELAKVREKGRRLHKLADWLHRNRLWSDRSKAFLLMAPCGWGSECAYAIAQPIFKTMPRGHSRISNARVADV
ncbi:MAG TPA: hypothetical protein VFZ58_00385 [Candidatus Saccharimonadales bacterium]